MKAFGREDIKRICDILEDEKISKIKIGKFRKVLVTLSTSKSKPKWLVSSESTIKFLVDEYIYWDNVGYEIDGKIIYFTYSGIDYQYQLLVEILERKHPDSKIYWGIVKKGDTISTTRNGCKVIIKHQSANPFEEKIIGAYVIVTIRDCDNVKFLSEKDIALVMSKARNKSVWNEFKEGMITKSIIRTILNQVLGVKMSSHIRVDDKNFDLKSKPSKETKVNKSALIFIKNSDFSTLEKNRNAFKSKITDEETLKAFDEKYLKLLKDEVKKGNKELLNIECDITGFSEIIKNL